MAKEQLLVKFGEMVKALEEKNLIRFEGLSGEFATLELRIFGSTKGIVRNPEARRLDLARNSLAYYSGFVRGYEGYEQFSGHLEKAKRLVLGVY